MAGRTDVKISVIVPVYNVEKELPRCIESLLTQTYSNFELLLINDGSSDGSPEIMERYAEKDPRIRTLHKKNGGVSSARNRGLEQAKGEYVCFVDADDVVASCYLEWLCRAIQESRLPLAICKQVDFEEKETDPFCDLPTEMPALKTHKIENYTFWDENVCTRCTLCLLHPAGFSDSSERLFTKTIQRNNYLGKNLCLGGKTAGQYEPYSGRAVRGGLRPCILPDGGQRPCRSGAASQDRADGARALAGGLASPEQQEA